METLKTIAIAGNPNVGKSTLFNSLTGLKQHTGNWAGKTVTNARGFCQTKNHSCMLVDIPGTYSLLPHSAEETVARDFICFAKPDAVIVICDATCLERNLNLVLQVLEITSQVILCVNLMDEAEKKGISINFPLLSKRLGIPVVGISARQKSGLSLLLSTLDTMLSEQPPHCTSESTCSPKDFHAEDDAYPKAVQIPASLISYEPILEDAIKKITDALSALHTSCPKTARDLSVFSHRFLALRLLDRDYSFEEKLTIHLGGELLDEASLSAVHTAVLTNLQAAGITEDMIQDKLVSRLFQIAEEIAGAVVACKNPHYRKRDMVLDRLFTGRYTAYPLMILLLAAVFWLTLCGSNYPSLLLSRFFLTLEGYVSHALVYISLPKWFHDLAVFGVFRVLGWVIAVMLPPMAIFFPLFTLLEDMGFLPRIAYNMDHCFKKCHACGKQALTMCMGFGCNAAGVVGCRIIDSKRERLIAILTNSFVPCNGRFPTLLALISIFFAGNFTNPMRPLFSALILTGFILLGIGMTFFSSCLLSKTVLKGVPSSFILELPPYRSPQLGHILLRSLLDRTLFVLGRAAAIAAPAGMLIWLLSNIKVMDISLLSHCAGFLNPFARLMGLDGVILMAFILGLPANEIVLPIILMAYLSQGSLAEYESLSSLQELLVLNGWTPVTALCTILFSMMHWPCSTTLMTIKKETGSLKWTFAAILLPTLSGIASCIAANLFLSLFL
ncbi:MAG: ferrous iron transport protein B [Lachnospiraceae bacterium]|nr:ferrous iron transport protein B [Lachnospiraceae bacterium]